MSTRVGNYSLAAALVVSSILTWRYQYRQGHGISRYIVAVKNTIRLQKYREYRRYHKAPTTGQRASCKLAVPKRTYRIYSYILVYKSQNLRQNLDPKVGGATYARVIK